MSENSVYQKLFGDFPPVSTALWEEKISEDLKGADYEKKLIWNTYEGIRIKPYYRQEHIQDLQFVNTLPGEKPYVRGFHSAGNDWEIRDHIAVEDVVLANNTALKALKSGAGALSFGIKYLAYHHEMNTLLQGIDLSKTPLHFFSSFSYSLLADLLLKAIADRKADATKVKGSMNFDAISYYLLHGEYYNSKEDNFNEAAALLSMLAEKLPAFKVININGQHFGNAGASITQELAFSLASGHEYLVELGQRGLSVDDVAPRMQFTFGTGSNYFLEIARLRAAKMLWASICEQHHPKNEESSRIYIHAVSSSWNKTIYDPYVNLLRLTTEAMSAALGGADAISLLPFDGLYHEASEFGSRLSRNIQHILKEESHLNTVADPSGGSYYIENLTHEIASMAWDIFKQIEKAGGMCVAMESGKIKADVEAVSRQKAADIEMRKVSVLGTSSYPNTAEQVLAELEKGTEDTASSYLKMHRAASAFEELRLATEGIVANGRKQPVVFLLTYGNLAMRKARATYSANFFGCAGFHVCQEYLYTGDEECIKAIRDAEADIVVLCSSDEEYSQAVNMVPVIKQAVPEIITVIAGYPKDIAEQLKGAGVDEFVHVRANALELLRRFCKLLKIV